MKVYKKMEFDSIDEALDWLNSNDKFEFDWKDTYDRAHYISHSKGFNLVSILQVPGFDYEDRAVMKTAVVFTTGDAQ